MITSGALLEILWVVGVTALGSLWWDRDGLPRWVAPAAMFLTGAALLALAGTLVIALRLPAPWHLVVAAALAMVAPRLILPRRRSAGRLRDAALWPPVVAVAVTVVQIMRHDAPLAVHSDSFRYLAGARAFVAGDHATLRAGLPKYGLAQQVLHAPAEAFGTAGWMSLAPLTAIATLVVAVWGVQLVGSKAGSSAGGPPLVALWVGGGATVVLLATNPWFLMHAVYLNAHLLIGAMVMLAAVLLVAQASGSSGASSRGAPVVVAGLLLAAVVLLRAEGALVAGLVLLPTLLGAGATERSSRERDALDGAWTLVGATTILFGLLAPVGRESGVLVGVGLLAVIAPQLARRLPESVRRSGLWAGEGLLWVAVLVLLVVPASTQLNRSLRPSIANVIGEGSGWGRGAVPLLLLVLLAVAGQVAGPAPRRLGGLRFPLTAFVPLGLLLAVGRDGAYRTAFEDSLNRMWVQVLPLGVTLVGAMVAHLLTGTATHRRPRRIEDHRLSIAAGATVLISLTASVTPLAVTTTSARPVAGAQELVGQVPFGELVTGTQVTGVLRPNILPTLRAADLDRPACVEVLFANYADRPNDGTVRLSFGPRDGSASVPPYGAILLDGAQVADNRPQRTCSEDITVRDVLAQPHGIEVRVEGVAGRDGSSVTVWLTEDTIDGQLLDPLDPDRSLVASLVVEQDTSRLLPRLPLAIGIIWGTVILMPAVPRPLRHARMRSLEAGR